MDAWFDVTQHLYTTVAEHYMWGWIALALVPWAIAVTAYAIWKLVLTRKIYESDYLDQVFLKNQIFGISSFTTRVSIDGEIYFSKIKFLVRDDRVHDILTVVTECTQTDVTALISRSEHKRLMEDLRALWEYVVDHQCISTKSNRLPVKIKR